MIRKLVCVWCCLCLGIATLWAQAVKSTHTTITDRHLFYVHQVVQGQTLSRLAVMYNVDVNTIIKYNPKAEKMLSIGQTLYIPVSNTDVEYYIVQAGDSWYKIARNHGISETELHRLNAYKVSTLLGIGDTLVVPYIQADNSQVATSISGSSSTTTAPAASTPKVKADNKPIQHTVSQGETLYAIARKYNKSYNEIKEANPGLSDNIVPGQVITIPNTTGTVQAAPSSPASSTIPATTVAVTHESKAETAMMNIGEKKNHYVVYVFIPLYLSQGSDINTSKIKTLDAYNNIKQFSFIQFYEAMLLATEDISKKYPHIQIDLRVEDVNNLSSARMDRLINDGSLKNADLIIGPFFGKEFSKLCQYAQSQKICLVNPFSVTYDGNGARVYKVSASYKAQAQKFAQYLTQCHSSANVIVVNNQSAKESAKASAYASTFRSAFSGKDITVKELNMQSAGIAGIKAAINPNCENYIFTFFEGEITVTNFVQTMHASKYENVTLVAPESWLDYDNIETEYFMDFKTHYISQFYVDYTRDNVMNFLERYRAKYNIEPTLDHFAFQGYDITYYFLSSLCEKGTAFGPCDAPNGNLLSTQFKFAPANNSIQENTFTNIFKLCDYHFIEATKNISVESTNYNK